MNLFELFNKKDVRGILLYIPAGQECIIFFTLFYNTLVYYYLKFINSVNVYNTYLHIQYIYANFCNGFLSSISKE